MPQTQQAQPPDTLPANFFDTQPPAVAATSAPQQTPPPQQALPPDTLPANFFDQPDDQRFSTASLGPNFQPDYETTVYSKPLPPDAPPGFWGSIWNHIKGAEMAPFDIGIPGIYRGAAQSSHLLANSMDLLDKTEGVLADMTGSRRVDWFKNAANWFRNQATGARQTADQWTGGNQSFPAEFGRGVVQGITQLPTLALATEFGGAAAPEILGEFGPSVMGFGGLGALEQEDKGPAAMFTGGAAGAATGGMFHITNQLGLPLRVPINSWLGYIQSRLGGANPSDALANGATMGLFSALPGAGGAGLRDITGNIVSPIADKFLPVSPEKSAAAQDVMNLGRKYEIPLTAGDISQEPSLKNMEVSLEKIPLQGMQKLRQVQEGRAKAAAQGIQSQYEQKLLDTDQSSLEELEAAAAAGDQRARNVQEKMIEAGNDPDRIIQASIGLGDWTTRQTANNLYDRVQNLAEEHNLGDVPMDATVKAINSSLRQLLPAKLPNKEVIRLLGDVKNSIVPEIDEEGNVTKQPDNGYGLIRQLHSDLGDRIREYYEGKNALIGEKGVGYLERTQNAIEDDMRNYALNSDVPEIVEAGRQADSYYKTARVPYKNGMLASAAVSNEPDQIFQQFIKAGKRDRAQQFYNALDDKGRAAVRYNMVSKAVEDAINPQSGIFSPQKLFTSVDKLQDAYGVFFKPQDLAEIRGFQNLMGHITRAGQYAENPPTGQRVIPILIAGGIGKAAEIAGAHPVGAAGMAALFGTMRGLFTTTRGRNLLLRAYGIKPGTGPMESTWQDVGRDMPKVSGKPPEEPPTGPPAGGPPPPPPTPTGGGAAAQPAREGEPAHGQVGQTPGGDRFVYDRNKGHWVLPENLSPAPEAAPETSLNSREHFELQNIAAEKDNLRDAFGAKEGWRDKLNEAADNAQDRIDQFWKDQGTGAAPNIGIPLHVLADYSIVGARKIVQGFDKFTDWSKEMRDEYGPQIEPHLRAVWKEAQHIGGMIGWGKTGKEEMPLSNRLTVPAGPVHEDAPPVSKKPKIHLVQKALDNLDTWTQRNPNMFANTSEYIRGMNELFQPKNGRVPIPPRNLIAYSNEGPALGDSIDAVTAGQRALADQGLRESLKTRQLYADGKMTPGHTALYFAWGALSPRQSPYPQEAGFLHALDSGLEKWIDKTAKGQFTDDTLPDYLKWAGKVLKRTPGAQATSNLNAFGKQFLTNAGKPVENGPYQGMRTIDALHSIVADQDLSAIEARRRYQQINNGLGLDNKVFSFVLLVTGRHDTLVADRVRINDFWDAPTLEKQGVAYTTNEAGQMEPTRNLYDNGMNAPWDGITGLGLYEAAEKALAPRVKQAYADRGIQDGTLGRWHWETWLQKSGQEVSHGSLGAIAKMASQGKTGQQAVIGESVRQGKYNDLSYGVRYERAPDGFNYNWEKSDGSTVALTPQQHNGLLKTLRQMRSKKVVPGYTEEERVIPRGTKTSEATEAPWRELPGVRKAALDRLIEQFASSKRLVEK